MNKIKKLLSLGMAVTMLTAAFSGFTVSAAEDYSDYVPGAKPQTLVTDACNTYCDTYFGTRTSGYVNSTYQSIDGIHTREYYVENPSNGAIQMSWPGVVAYEGLIFNNDGLFTKMQGGKNYVLALKVKNTSDTAENVKIGMSMNSYNPNYQHLYPIGCPEGGVAIGKDWTEVKGTFVLPEGWEAGDQGIVNDIYIGFPQGTASDAKFAVNCGTKAEDLAVYFNEEVAYDIHNTISSTAVSEGGSVTASAEVVNQIGTQGGLAQNFTWKVVNEDRTAVVNMPIVVSDDTASATVTIDSSIPAGTYYLLAKSALNGGMYKGAEFTVLGKQPYADYIPGEIPQTLVTDACNTYCDTYFGTRTSGYVNSTYQNIDGIHTREYYVENPSNGAIQMSWPGVVAYEGLIFNNKGLFTKVQGGKNYVLALKVKNTSDTAENVKIGMSMNSYGPNYQHLYPIGCPEGGVAIGKDWTEVKGTFVLPAGWEAGDQNIVNNIYIGFPKGTASDAKFAVNCGTKAEDLAVYFNEEVVYNILMESTAENTVFIGGGSADFSASVINQIGTTGGLSQQFDWCVLDSERINQVDGITLTVSEDTKSVTASWSEELADGEYYIAATSREYGIIRTSKIIKVSSALAENSLAARAANAIPDASADYGTRYLAINNNLSLGYAADTSAKEIKWTVNDGYSETSAAEGEMWRGFYGFELGEDGNYRGTSEAANHIWNLNPQPGKTYVIYAKVRNISTNGNIPYFGSAMNDEYNTGRVTYTNEYGSEGMAVTSSNWQEYKATITLPDNYIPTQAYGNRIFMGINKSLQSGGGFAVDVSDKDSVYVAQEQPAKVQLTYTPTTTIEAGTTIDIPAEVVNQIGIKGTLSQDIEWYCVDETGTKAIDGVHITKTKTGARLYFRDDVNDDGIQVFAVSKAYGLAASTQLVMGSLTDPRTIYVSPRGNDSYSGSAVNPLASLNGARKKIAELKALGVNAPIEVIFRGGVYRFDNTVSFTADDSGTETAPITYKAAEGEKVVFSGATNIDLSSAQKVTDEAVKARLKDSVKDKVVVIDLGAQGIDSMSSEKLHATIQMLYKDDYEHPRMFLDGNEQMLSQWPNGDGEYATYTYNNANSIIYSDDEPSTWGSAKDVWVGGYLGYDYIYKRIPVSSVIASSKVLDLQTIAGTVEVDDTSSSSTPVTNRWKAYNLLEEIDVPTEWYIDKDNMLLYYYPPYEVTDSTVELAVLKDNMISLSGLSYVNFEGIEFEKTRGMAISANNIRNITVKDCDFRYIGSNAIYIAGTQDAQSDAEYWQRQKIDAAYDTDVFGCRFSNIGGYGVYLDGGNVDTLTPGNNTIHDCIFYKCSEQIKGYEVIMVKGCGNIVEHNNISCSAFQAIRSYGNDHKIRYNEIYDVIRETDDAGAIYQGRNTIQRGTEISYNYIHDIIGTSDTVFNHKPAIYWDDYQTGMTAEHNIIANAYINVYTNGVDNHYNYNTSVNMKGKNIEYRDGGAASNTTDDGTGDTYNLASGLPEGSIRDTYYAKYESLKQIFTSSDGLKVGVVSKAGVDTARQLSGLNQVKGNVNVNADGTSVTSNSIGDYTNYPNATYKKKNIFSSTYVVDQNGTQNPNVVGNDDNASGNFVNAAAQDYRMNTTGDYTSSVLNTSFDIELIGVQGDNSVLSEAPKPASPYNKEVIEPANSTIHFVWSEVFGATKYTVQVASDSSFGTVVASAEVYNTYADVTIPDAKVGDKYYWRVIATNTSREFADSVIGESAMFVFGDRVVVNVEKNVENNLNISIENRYSTTPVEAHIFLAEYAEDEHSLSFVQYWHEQLSYNTPLEYTAAVHEWNSGRIMLFVWDKDFKGLRSATEIKK